MRNYKKIIAWEKADELTIQIYSVTKKFPREEIFGLTHQIRKASVSVAANIAEGAARESKREYLHFLYIARGSLAETEYFLKDVGFACVFHLSHKLAYLSEPEFDSLSLMCNAAFGTLAGLIKSVKKETSVMTKAIAKRCRLRRHLFLTSGLVLYGIKCLSLT